MNKPRYPQSRLLPLVAVALIAAFVGIGVPAAVTTLFTGYAPHVDEVRDN
jgi:Flp pilus assembly pilin Flp